MATWMSAFVMMRVVMVGQILLLVAHANGVLDGVHHGSTSATVSSLVLLVAGLVGQALTGALLRVRLHLTRGLSGYVSDQMRVDDRV